MRVYEVIFDHQYQGENYGIFSSLQKAEDFLKTYCLVKIDKKSTYPDSIHYDGGYMIKIRDVK